MTPKTLWELGRQTVFEWQRHEATRLGASLAFYAILSLAPLVILTIALAGSIVGLEAAQQQVLMQFQELLGPAGATAVHSMIAHAQNVRATSIASALGLVTLLFGASQIFSELQSALNKIWEVDSFKTGGVLAIIRPPIASASKVPRVMVCLLCVGARGSCQMNVPWKIRLPVRSGPFQGRHGRCLHALTRLHPLKGKRVSVV